MRYPKELNDKFKSFQAIENNAWGDSSDAKEIFRVFSSHQQTQVFSTGLHSADYPLIELRKGYEAMLNTQANLVYLELNTDSSPHEQYHFQEFRKKLEADNYLPNEPLPEAFFIALKESNFYDIDLGDYINFEGLVLKTFSDLPEAFIKGIKNKTIAISPSDNETLKREAYINRVAKICAAMPKRPLTLLVYGSNHNHTASYIARIDENNEVELLALNSLPGYKTMNETIIDQIREGIKKGLGLEDKHFNEASYRKDQQSGPDCSFITSMVLSHVDPDKTLADQVKFLEQVMRASIINIKKIRRLYARILWLQRIHQLFGDQYGEIYPENNDDHPAMHNIFKQLFYFLTNLDAPEKMDIPAEHVEVCAKFLDIFGLKINDKNFLKLFNPVGKIEDPNPEEDSEKSSSTTSKESVKKTPKSEKERSYFNPKTWPTHCTELLKKLDINEDNKAELEHALNNLANHAHHHLNSVFNTERAKMGHKKYTLIQNLLENSEDLNSLHKSIEEILNTKNPEKSDLLKNRRGFFGAYKTICKIANHRGYKNYKFKTRIAISRTDHYLIELHHALNKLISEQSSSLSQSTI